MEGFDWIVVTGVYLEFPIHGITFSTFRCRMNVLSPCIASQLIVLSRRPFQLLNTVKIQLFSMHQRNITYKITPPIDLHCGIYLKNRNLKRQLESGFRSNIENQSSIQKPTRNELISEKENQIRRKGVKHRFAKLYQIFFQSTIFTYIIPLHPLPFHHYGHASS